MKYTQIALATLTAIFVAACGGGSNNDMAKDSQNSSRNQQPSPPASNNQPSPPASNNQPSPPASNNQSSPSNANLVRITGNYIKIDTGNGYSTLRYGVNTPQSNLDWLFINGRPHYLRPAVKSTEAFVKIENKVDGRNEDIIASNHLSYTSYGIVKDNISKQNYVFAQGIPTMGDRVPNTKGVFYRGHALHGEINGHMTAANSIFAIDFSKQKVTGRIQLSNTEIPLEANLRKDASFSGTNRLGTAVQGHLFGPGYEEIGGTYLNVKENFHGSFGAAQTPSLK
ncbi:MAG: transferrin-binding protein-like solute binding protein [Cardiobacteriaceae bacterium]|nr:transferrin-binding protein-like solute binding protein [Cardiobacteriaceae bacterium]